MFGLDRLQVTQLELQLAIQDINSSDECRFFLTLAGCSVQTGYKDFHIWKNELSKNICLVNGDDEGNLYVCKGSHHFTSFSREALREMADFFVSKPVVPLTNNVFVGHSYLQYACAEYLGHVNLRYRVYLSRNT